MGLVRAGVAVFLTALALAPAAQAERYAAPSGSGPEPCAATAPCSLKEAISKAKANDEVVVTGGSYTVPATIAPEGPASNLYIHGDFGGPMPQIVGSGALTIYNAQPGARLAYLEMSNKGAGSYGAFCYSGGRIERVRASVSGEFAAAMAAYGDCTVRDSVALATGTNSMALVASVMIGSYTAVARNVTALATGTGSRGVAASCTACIGGSITFDLRNVIANGGGKDIEPLSGSFSKILVSNSNFDTTGGEAGAITNLGGNQTAAPLFVNGEAGDYREAAGSPTIDAGAADAQLGSLDMDGNPRTVGAAPDIGAYEFVPPAVPAPASGEIQSLAIAPKAFKPVNAGGAIFSATKRKKAPFGTTVTHSLSAAGTVEFSVERRLPGRKVGKRCVKQTRANKTKKRCSRFKPVKGSFNHSGQVGANSFKFSGRLNGKGLKPGRYRLIGKTGSVSKTASFTIVK
jgi:hypothetical protein